MVLPHEGIVLKKWAVYEFIVVDRYSIDKDFPLHSCLLYFSMFNTLLISFVLW